MQPEELAAKYAGSFPDFCKEVLGYKDMNKIHRELCLTLQFDPHKSKMFLMPRNTFKSSVITCGYALFKIIDNPNIRILLYSDSATKAQGFLTDIKNHLEGKAGGSRFREIYGDWTVSPREEVWNTSQITVGVRTDSRKEPTIDTAGIETSRVGMHYDLIIFDDIVTDINTTTKAQMDKTYECYQKSLSLLKPGGEILIVGTRWSFGDAYGRIIDENQGNPSFKIIIKKAYEDTRDGKTYNFADCGEESLTPEFLEEKKFKLGRYFFSCNPYEAPILMSDFTCKPIGEVRVGDEVVGFTTGNREGQRRLIKARVLKAQSRISPVVKLYMESGRVLRCTPDHQWFTGRTGIDKSHKVYLPAKIGRELMFICSPEIESGDSTLASWLGGFYDGEGSCQGGSIVFNQSHVVNKVVCDKLEIVLNTLNFKWNKRIDGPTKSTLGGDVSTYWINGGLEANRRFLHLCHPAKKAKVVDLLYRNGGKPIKEKDKVVKIDPDGEEPVYALVTETGNYIAWGYASKNCLYLNNPASDDSAVFKSDEFVFFNDIATDQLYKTITIDPAGQGEDFTAMVVCGTDAGGRTYILDIVNQHLSPSEIVREIFRLSYKWKFVKLGIETNTFQGMLEDDIKFERNKHALNKNYTDFSVETFRASIKKGEGKHQRILSLQPLHQRGVLRFRGKNLDSLPKDYADLADQMLKYTYDGPKTPHDDIIDALSYQVKLIRNGSVMADEEAPENSLAWEEKRNYEKVMKLNKRLPRMYRRKVQLYFQ